MIYNIYIHNKMSAYNIMGLSEEKMQKVVSAYKKGKKTFTITGKEYFIDELREIQIFTHEHAIDPKEFEKQALTAGLGSQNLIGEFLSPEVLAKVGQNVTDDIIGDIAFGDEKETKASNTTTEELFVAVSRIQELRSCINPSYDLTKLIRLCEELNSNYQNKNYYAVGMLGRSIIDHVPPIFGLSRFNEVTNNYGTKSFKESMDILNGTLRKISDGYLHTHIRSKEVLPTKIQINFSHNLDILLAEIVRILKSM